MKKRRVDGKFIALAVIASVCVIVSLICLFLLKITADRVPENTPELSAPPSETPVETAPATPDPGEESEESVLPAAYDDVGKAESAAAGDCSNAGAVSCRLSGGGEFSLGIECPDTNYIYLVPECSYASADNPVAYYISSDRVPVEYGDSDPSGFEAYPGVSEFILTGQTFDTLIPARYRGEDDFGCRWKNNIYFDGASGSDADTSLYIRAVDLKGQYVLAVLRAEIKYNAATETFGLTRLSDNDVSATGELSLDAAAAAVSIAEDCLTDSSKCPNIANLDKERIMSASTVVEKVPCTYFYRFFDYEGAKANRGGYLSCDVYAVTFDVIGLGPVTFYFAPKRQLYEAGKGPAPAPGFQGPNLFMFGYDAICPFNAETLVANNAGLFD